MHDPSPSATRDDEARAPATTAADWIRRLDLVPHPEGGFNRET